MFKTFGGRRRVLILVLLSLGLMALRAPFLTLGYGLDLDNERVVRAAHEIAETGHYVASRFPGYPVQEYAYAWLPVKTPLTFNLLTSIFAFAAQVLFSLLLCRYRCRDWFLASLAFGLLPVVFINGCNAMDYLWGLAFLLGSFHLALLRRPVLAGVLLGLATGCRITSAAAFLPCALLLARREGRWDLRPPVLFAAAALPVVLLAYWPVFQQYGRTLLTFSDDRIPTVYVLKKISLQVWGILGSVVLGAMAVPLGWNLLKGRREGSIPRDVPVLHVTSWGLMAFLFVLVFVRLPHEGAYILPAIPFLFLLLARGLPRKWFQILCGGFLVSSLFGNIKSPELSLPEQISPLSFRVEMGERELIVDFLYGPLIADYIRRRMDVPGYVPRDR